ncbi:protein CHAPERONE-LIKE PROTEIN OF POR1, chloroplastic-like isoform X1 [Zingiber officinale]|uniref:protein CHAPERONE-LIKE PROTEIN OF POR1, chloroplastic-like isoform X1 n=1 Tax=Zingiber officinale TaxID=94328 RepID=UPI001C4C2ECE|nr:protein CHAPERONE-LIKE PROTEIN OF POR1, chloroplastic-like isoform X1 [Zingiber officinale]
MSAYCLPCNPTRFPYCKMPTGVSSSLHCFVSPLNQNFADKIQHITSKGGCLICCRKYSTSVDNLCVSRRSYLAKTLVRAAFGDTPGDSPSVFPRIPVKDPYKRLGISREASEEEIQAARNFLVQKYSGHQPSVDAIESAYDKIIMQSLYNRRRPKLNLDKKVRDITQSPVYKAVTSRFEAPSTKVILKTALAFIVLGVLTVLFPTEEGPTLQVAISLITTIYFIHERLKSGLRAFLYGVGAFIFSWLLGTFLMVSVMPPLPLLQGPRSLEVSTSVLSYILLWVSSTYLK